MGPDRGTDRLEQGQRRQAVHPGDGEAAPGLVEPCIQHPVGRLPAGPVREVHEQEGDVVRDVDLAQRRSELDAVE